MLRVSAAAALIVLAAGCAGIEPAGRNARNGGAPVIADAPARPAPQRTLPPPQTTPAPQQQAAVAPPPQQLPPPQAAPVTTPPPQQMAAVSPPPVQTAPAPAPRTAPPPQPEVAAQGVSAPPAPRPRPRASDDIVVPGVQERQVPPPAGDPRSVSERMQDINAWDRCVARVQAAGETDPTRPSLESPEEVCSQSLGMATRTAVPDSRIRR